MADPAPPEAGPSAVAVTDAAGQIRQQVEQEQALADAQKRVKALEDELGKVKEEERVLSVEKGEAASVADQLRTQLSTVQSNHHKSTSELAVLQTRVDAVEREKRELFEETERLQQRSSRSTQELYTLRSQRTESSQKIAHLDVEVSELRMTAESSKFNEERATQALNTARQEVLNLSKSVADVEERFGRYRAEKAGQTETSQLSIEQSSLISRLTATENSHNSLRRAYDDQSRRLAEAHANIATLTSSAASRKASTSVDLQRLVEENRVLEQRGEEGRLVIAEREAELERLAESFEERQRVWEERLKKEERIRKETERRTDDLRVVVERLALAGGEGGDLSSAASIAGSLKAQGKSYTEFYTQYTVLEKQLQDALEEIERLTSLLDQISQEIIEKKPLLDEQAAEHAHAIERANALATELASAIAARDQLDSKVKTLNASSSHSTDELSSLRSTVDDLSRQVQNLLRQLAIRDDPALASQALDGSFTVSDSGDIVSDHLVEFRSIRSLQEQNSKLLRLTRGLMAKLDAREISRATAENDEDAAETSAALDEASRAINTLHEQLLDAHKKVNEVTRERDLFSKLLARGEGLRWSASGVSGGDGGLNGSAGDSQGAGEERVQSLQAELEIIKRRAEGEVRDAKAKMGQAEEAKGMEQVERVKAEAKVALLDEQLKMLSETNGLQKTEVQNLERQLGSIQNGVHSALSQAREAAEQVASKQAEVDRLRGEAATLRAEKEQWQSTETRLHADFRTVQSERARLQQLIESLNNVSAENERTRAEDRAKAEARVEGLQREATALRSQIETAREATRAAEQKVADFDSRLSAATAAVRTEKEAAEALAQTRQEEVNALNAQLATLTDQSSKFERIGRNWKNRADELTSKTRSDAEALAAKDSEIAQLKAAQESAGQHDKDAEELRGKLQVAEKERDELRAKLGETEKTLEGVRRSEGLKEGTVQRLQSELNAAQSRAQASAAGATPGGAGDQALLNTIRKEKEALQAKLTQTEKDLESAKAAATTGTPAAGAAAGTDPAAEGSGEVVGLKKKVEELEKERKEQEEKREREVIQVNRVNANLKKQLSTLAAVQKSNDERESRVKELEKEVEELKAQLAAAPSASFGTSANAPGEASTTTAATEDQQAKIAEAVRAAVAAKESELEVLHAQALAEARSSVSAPASGADSASIEAATAPLRAQIAALEKEKEDLKAQIEALNAKIKSLEKTVKTAEISRKTLERQKADAESRLKRLEDAGASTATGATDAAAPAASAGAAGPGAVNNAGGLSAAAPAFAPGQGASAGLVAGAGAGSGGAGPSTTVPTGPSRGRGGMQGVRGAVRGRGTGRGGGNNILNAVDAHLSKSSPTAGSSDSTPIAPAPAAAAGTKRPLEEGEIGSDATGAGGAEGTAGAGILGRIQGQMSGGPGQGNRIKRPKPGTGPGRGGGPQRRPSGPGGAGGGGAGTGSSGDGAGATGGSTGGEGAQGGA